MESDRAHEPVLVCLMSRDNLFNRLQVQKIGSGADKIQPAHYHHVEWSRKKTEVRESASATMPGQLP